jgi:DNA primase
MMIPAHLVEIARAADILAVAQRYAALKRVATNEWAGPCPVCGGRDRFSVNMRKRLFNCRGGGGKGDVIALVMHVDGCSFSEAVERLAGRPIEARQRGATGAAGMMWPAPARRPFLRLPGRSQSRPRSYPICAR